ncbi:DUF397 domain-containing protein [Streptomyces hiroshimensis]|uniref:DUF397 domain-containing protein n=1 Tax=Streptomyces hiroshimensis TaxID=66424 RepID=A0ABQ2YZJ0_9ACTN|nr:DUF397 domain-containing protein [Streptomyces hiroshimensis]GGY00440.1 hypothetical protein GCM10010324_53920 [Streptomyces hiroshimensis]
MRHQDRHNTASGNTSWRKSSYSGHQGDCIQIADDATGIVSVRDSKNPQGPALALPAGAWAAFVSHVKGTDLPG